MKNKENLSKKRYFNEITKLGLLENDKKLLMKKLGFKNLSQYNLIKKKNSSFNNKNQNNFKFKKQISSLKIETNPNQNSSFLKNLSNKDFKNNKTSTTKNNTLNISLFSTKEYLNAFYEFKKSSGSLLNISDKKKMLYRNNKSCSSLFKDKPHINFNKMSNSTYNKRIRLIKEIKNDNSNNITFTQNSIKKNIKSNLNFDLLGLFPKLESIKKNKNKKKLNINVSTPNLLYKTKKPIIKDKEKSYKIFNDRGFMNKNLYNFNNNKYRPIIMTANNSKDKNRNKIKRPLNISNEYLQMTKPNYINKKENKINKKLNPKYYNQNQLSTIIQSDVSKKDKSKVNINLNISASKNSEDTKKESRLDLNKIFNDKILNLKNKSHIYDIISLNMKKNLSNKKLLNNANNNTKINEQNTINIEDEDEDNDNDNYNIININSQNELNKKILLSNINNNNTKRNLETNKKDKENTIKNKSSNNIINYSDINENINNNILEEKPNRNSKNSSFKTSKNMNNNYYNLMILNITNKEEQEFQSSQDKNNNDQTQTTIDRNNIISKFIKQPIYNISPRFFSTEMPLIAKDSFKSKPFIFIKDIEQINKNIPLINIEKILSLKDKDIFKLLSFSYDNYSSIISSSNLLKRKFYSCLKNIFKPIIVDFQNKYKDFLKVLNFSFEQKQFYANHKKNNSFDLIIKSQIITKEVDKSYEIGFNYISNGKKYDNIWKFDIKNKKDIKLWLCTELNKVNKIKNNFTYTSQVSSFAYLDEIILEFNIFSKGNNIEPNSIEWTDPIISNESLDIYENSKFLSSVEYDQLRACEVETQILFWKNQIVNDKGIVEDFKKIFEKNFKIKEVNYDISKFYFFKFKMVANKVGVLKQNKYLTFDINIVEYESKIQNEIQCIYLINSNFYTKAFDIRLNTLLIFYIIDMKR